MKNTFKKIIAVISSAAVLMAGNVTLSVSAVEKTEYTFVQLTEMSVDEIRAISDEAAKVYDKVYTSALNSKTSIISGTEIDVEVSTYNYILDASEYEQMLEGESFMDFTDGINQERLIEDLGCSGLIYVNYVELDSWEIDGVYYDRVSLMIDFSNFSGCDELHVLASFAVFLELHPNVMYWQYFPPVIAPMPIEIGDANADGNINAMDATVVARYAVGSYTFTNRNAMLAADVNGDYEVNAMDATMIARYAVGEIESFE